MIEPVSRNQRQEMQMSEYMFGVGRTRPTRKDAKQIQRIAEAHDADFIEMFEPGCSCGYGCRQDCPSRYKHWFATDNLGSPHDQRVQRETIAAIEAAGLGSALGWD